MNRRAGFGRSATTNSTRSLFGLLGHEVKRAVQVARGLILVAVALLPLSVALEWLRWAATCHRPHCTALAK